MTTATSNTLTPSFSFYVDAGKPDLIKRSMAISDGVAIRGRAGPKTIGGIRPSPNGLTALVGHVVFDRAAYAHPENPVDAVAWSEEQAAAGATRLLTPGRWIGFDRNPSYFEAELSKEVALAEKLSSKTATILAAIDHRWLSRRPEHTASILSGIDRPVALAIGNRADPLSVGHAVDGLIGLSRSTKHLTMLRVDHGGIGAMAFGAAHAALGLRPANRHVVPPGQSGGGKRDDTSARVFVPSLLDWFTAGTIAGWAAAGIPVTCELPGCNGEPLSRFFDPRLADDAAIHNTHALAAIASYIVNASRHERRRLFAELCQKAVGQYDRLGSMAIQPKGQLESWALWA